MGFFSQLSRQNSWSAAHNFILAGILLLLSLLITAYAKENPELARLPFKLTASLTSPITNFASSTSNTVTSLLERYAFLRQTQEENIKLRERLVALEGLNLMQVEVARENEQLRELLNMKTAELLSGVAARVISASNDLWTKTIRINAGTDLGVNINCAVLANHHVVGQVIQVERENALVMLVTDHRSGIDAIAQSSSARGIAEGNGGADLRISYITKDQPIAVGDIVVTGGADGIFPKGQLIGAVSGVVDTDGLFKSVSVAPKLNSQKLENVFVTCLKEITR